MAISSIALAFLSFVELVREFAQLPAEQIPVVKTYFTWITAGQFKVDFSLQVDQLTIIMLGVVTFVSLLVHIYSTGYMAHEEGYYRFFSYLNLFVFFMLTLVLAANVVLMFVGWEGVGLCSYLLIGFWFLKQSAISAGKKAFITTRIGDFGFTIGILLLFWTFKSVDFGTIFKQLVSAPPDAAVSTGVLDHYLPAALYRRGRQISATPALCLAARRDGRPHARQRLDPRRHHGDRRRVHGRAHESAFLARACRHVRRRADRRAHRVLRRHHRPGADGHQESSRLLHRLAARLHVPGPAASAPTLLACST